MCVGAAVADDVRGPYRPAGDRPLVCPPHDGSDIDPQGSTDTDGTRYLLYMSPHGTGEPSTLRLPRVAPAGRTPTGGRKPLLRVDAPDEKGVIEAPFLRKTGGGYTLLHPAGTDTDGSYHTSYATASTVDGPYRKAGALLATDGPGGAAVADGTLPRPQGPRALFPADPLRRAEAGPRLSTGVEFVVQRGFDLRRRAHQRPVGEHRGTQEPEHGGHRPELTTVIGRHDDDGDDGEEQPPVAHGGPEPPPAAELPPADQGHRTMSTHGRPTFRPGPGTECDRARMGDAPTVAESTIGVTSFRPKDPS